MLDPAPGKALLTAGEVAHLVNMEPRTFARLLVQDPSFPRPINTAAPGAKRPRWVWRKDEVLEWIIRRPRQGA